MPVAEKTQDTETRLQAAQARVAALQVEASGLTELMQQARGEAKADEYFHLMAREHVIPRELAELEAEVRTHRRQALEERYAANAAAEPELRVKYEETIRRNRERIAAIEAESAAASSAYHANVQEARVLEQELQAMGVVS